jgi:pimeloyl-ACP methyl ester carboxylesterase
MRYFRPYLYSLLLCLTGLAQADSSPFLQWFVQQYPEYLAQGQADFGWRIYAPAAGWQELPAELPVQPLAVLMQGLDDTGKVWMNLAPVLTADGFAVLELRYPNDQAIHLSAEYLKQNLLELQSRGATEFALVTHSMGGLIARDLLTAPDLAYLALSRSRQAPRCQRLIMVAPPNHGSQLAHLRLASEIREHTYKVWTGQGTLLGPFLDGQGQAGKDLLPGSPFLKLLNQRRLPPELPVTIIAGLLNDDAPQLGDGAVSLEATKLAEVSDFHVFTASHLFLIRNISPESNRVPPAVPLIRTLLQPLRPTTP